MSNRDLYNKDIQNTVIGIINTIEKELDINCGSCFYQCVEGNLIHTDVGYVYEWFQEYKEVLKKRYGIK